MTLPVLTCVELITQINDDKKEFTKVSISDGLIDDTDIESVNFSGSTFRRVVFSKVLFRDVSFNDCEFIECGFRDCVYEAASHKHSQYLVKGAVSFESARLGFVHFTFTDSQASLTGSIRFDGASLTYVHFVGAMLDANFREASLKFCEFSRCNLASCYGLEFDSTTLDQSRFPRRPPSYPFRLPFRLPKPLARSVEKIASRADHWLNAPGYPKWLHLVERYSGPAVFLYLTLTTLFVAKNAIGVTLKFLAGATAEKVRSSVGDTVADAAGVTAAPKIPLWEVLLGVDSGSKLTVITTLVLISYTLCRAWVTVQVSKSWHIQEVSLKTPPKSNYWYLWQIDRVLSVVLLFVIVLTAVSVLNLLFLPIPIA